MQKTNLLSCLVLLPLLAACGGSGSSGDFIAEKADVLEAFASAQSLTQDIPRTMISELIEEPTLVSFAGDVDTVPTGSASYTGIAVVETARVLTTEESRDRLLEGLGERTLDDVRDFGFGDDVNFSATSTMTAEITFDGTQANAVSISTGPFFEQTDIVENGRGIRLDALEPITGTVAFSGGTTQLAGSITKSNGDVLTFDVPMSLIVSGDEANTFIGTGGGTATLTDSDDVRFAAGFFGQN